MSELFLEDLGKVYSKEDSSRLLHPIQAVGECEDIDGNEFTMKHNVDGALIIESKATGRCFVVDWQSAVSLALFRGILGNSSKDGKS